MIKGCLRAVTIKDIIGMKKKCLKTSPFIHFYTYSKKNICFSLLFQSKLELLIKIYHGSKINLVSFT